MAASLTHARTQLRILHTRTRPRLASDFDDSVDEPTNDEVGLQQRSNRSSIATDEDEQADRIHGLNEHVSHYAL